MLTFLHQLTKQTKLMILSLLVLVPIGILSFVNAIPQDKAYHDFADQRVMFEIPNSFDVLSNLPFCLVGLWGMVLVFNKRRRHDDYWQWQVLFTGCFLIGLGSAYYHWNPNNATLLWDRLPMTVAFMGIISLLTSERLSPKGGKRSLPFLIFIGCASAIYWYWSELQGRGDLRAYVLVQFGSMAYCLAMLLLYEKRDSNKYWSLLLGFYVLAKVFEATDEQVYSMTQELVSGHSLKHLASAVALAMLFPIVKMEKTEN